MEKSEINPAPVVPVYKMKGETPLECINRFKEAFPEYESLPMTYAGRLDPLAEGLLILLAGKECKKKDEYLGLDKEYIVEVLFGIKTDSGDLLGIPEVGRATSINENDLMGAVSELQGTRMQKYPAFSSKTVSGKPLFAWTRSGEEIERPTRSITVHDAKLLNVSQISGIELLLLVEKDISLVKGDFRQGDIIEKWKELLFGKDLLFKTAKIRICSSSGTYMRVLAEGLAEALGSLGFALSIKRVRVGSYILHE